MSQRQSEVIAAAARRIAAWLEHEALPVWARVGHDGTGGFVEILDLDATPQPDAERRIRVQARQIYVFTHAALLGLGPAAGHKALALEGFDWLIRHGWDAAAGGFFHRLDGQGAPRSALKDTYDHAFILFALAWLYKATGDSTVRQWIDKTADYLETQLRAHGDPAYQEGEPASLPRRQNPHMHLLEAFLALHDATGEAAFAERADAMVALFQTRFFDRAHGTLTEFFAQDWTPAPGDSARIVEPGHHFEWAYLLHTHAAARGLSQPVEAVQLLETARARGLDPETGLAYDEIWRDPAAGVKSARKRLWPQTEALRTHLVLGGEDPVLRGEVGGWVERIFTHYIEPAPRGTWMDVRGADNAAAATTIPASTFYHLFSAFAAVLAEVPVREGPSQA